eukprot:gb/GEZN01029539.1/.p1 GENE.gb/GEZN01029539.1/~~gb/GEZN01029539.1/.p1  ORF type:complete len:124 (-),score=15.31 gb/GEZN01029539.1/:54-425(-)
MSEEAQFQVSVPSNGIGVWLLLDTSSYRNLSAQVVRELLIGKLMCRNAQEFQLGTGTRWCCDLMLKNVMLTYTGEPLSAEVCNIAAIQIASSAGELCEMLKMMHPTRKKKETNDPFEAIIKSA